jgi:RES domain-containing protein
VKVIYTAGSRALACLENVVHRTSRGLQDQFKTLIIKIPESIKILVIEKNTLAADWQQYLRIPNTQELGMKWVQGGSSAVLQVPSVIIPEEHNYVLNPAHKDFARIKLIGAEPFDFDDRIKPD